MGKKGGEGGIELAKAILRTLDNKESNYKPLYTYDDTNDRRKRSKTIATKIYGADKSCIHSSCSTSEEETD